MSENAAKIFGHDTEAGRLMAKLYGHQKYTPVPLPTKTKPMTGPQPRMVFNDSALTKEFNREAVNEFMHTVDEYVRQPTPKPLAPIERRGPGLRSKAQIEALKKNSPSEPILPPIKPGFNNPDREKARLTSVFSMKGGKALPECALPEPIRGNIPLATASDSKRKSRPMRERSEVKTTILDELQLTFNEISKSMEDMEAYAAEMRSLGAFTSKQEQQYQRDMKSRLAELHKIKAQIDSEIDKKT